MLLEHFVPYCKRSSYSFLLELNVSKQESKRKTKERVGCILRFYLCNWACKFALNADTYFLMFTYFVAEFSQTNERMNERAPFYSIIACLGLLCGVYSFFVFLVKSAHQTLSTAMNAHFYLIFWAISMRYRAVSNQQLRITSSNLKCMKRVSYYFYYIYSGFIVYYPNTAKRLWWHFYGHMASNTITIKKIRSNDKTHIAWLPRHKSPAIPTNKPIQIILSTPISDKTLE